MKISMRNVLEQFKHFETQKVDSSVNLFHHIGRLSVYLDGEREAEG
jgi:hypothetical protein